MTTPLIGDVTVEITDWFEKLQVSDGLTFDVDRQSLKFLNEAQEFAAEPHKMDEAADVFISLIGTLWVQDLDLQDLARAVSDKMEVLRGRTWGVAQDGTYQHVRGCEECGNDDGPHRSGDRNLCMDCLEDTISRG